MYKIFILLLLSLLTFKSFGQSLEVLNGFKYFTMMPLKDNQGNRDNYKIEYNCVKALSSRGMKYLSPDNKDNWPQDAQLEPCKIAFLFTGSSKKPNSWNCGVVQIQIRNCKNEVIYSKSVKSNNAVCSYPYECCYYKWGEALYGHLTNLNYKYNPEINHLKTTYPTVEKIDLTEDQMKEYYKNNSIDPIEGIYKSYQSESLSHYKFGVKKFGDVYKAVIIESESAIWKEGEVKAIFERSSIPGVYSVSWHMGNKSKVETFASLKDNAILEVEYSNDNGEKVMFDFIKIYPTVSGVKSSEEPNTVKATGSGFVFHKDGLIATNAHVVDGADSIEVNFNGTTYSAKLLLKDRINDVAVLQLNNLENTNISNIPFVLKSNADIGEDVFTIGYPLSNVMGEDFKVTSGIISSKSGIQGDIRYYQTTTPIQPGNSGGPLFNSEGDIVGLTTAKLNGEAIGSSVENVNYAIKVTYLLNLFDMLPNSRELNQTNRVASSELKGQVKQLKDYVCLIKIY